MRRALAAALVIVTGFITAGCNDGVTHLKNGFDRPIGVGDEMGLRMVLSMYDVPEDKLDCMVDKLMANYVTQTQMGAVRYWWEPETLNRVAAECGFKVTKLDT
jgi:hypothetical protein